MSANSCLESADVLANISSPYLAAFNNKFNCDSVDEDFFAKLDQDKNDLFILSLNIQSFHSKKDKFRNLLNSLNFKFKLPHVICLQETHLQTGIPPPTIPGFSPLISNHRCSSTGGGVGILVGDQLSYSVNDKLQIFIERVIECSAIDFFIDNKKFTLLSIYRPPSTPNMSVTESFNLFLTNFYRILSMAPTNTIIAIDSNINLDLKTNFGDRYVDSIVSNGFLNLINVNTRINMRSCTSIDQIISNCNNISGISGTIVSDVSDHFPTFSILNFAGKVPTSKPKMKRFFSEENYAIFNNQLSNLNWDEVLNKNNTEEAYLSFSEMFGFLFEQSFPLKKVLTNRRKFPMNAFFTPGLLISRNTKNDLFKKFMKNRIPENEQRYKTYRNIFNRTVRTAKKIYFSSNIESNPDMKSSWHFINEALGRGNTNKDVINNLCVNSSVISNPESMANHFNEFFSTITNNIVDEMGHTSATVSDFLPPKTTCTFNFKNVTTGIVADIIEKIDSKTSLDIYGYNMVLIKKCSKFITKPLTHIINLSLSTGVFPDALKTARICPVFKSGTKSDPNNYRPISCLPAISKIIEKIVFNQLFGYISTNKLISNLQFGFQPRKSCQQMLVHFLNYIAEAYNENKIVAACFLDLRKAFDMVDHDILFLKLENIGISNNSLAWLKSYLMNRKTFVSVNNTLSSNLCSLIRGVPQGSILGPLLFLIFINDLPNSSLLSTYLFADDTSALAKGHNLQNVGSFMNRELQHLGTWLRANKLAINTSKTKIIVFANNRDVGAFNFVFNNNDINTLHNPNLVLPLERITKQSPNPAVKLLGVFFDEGLTFDTHINKLKNKINSSLFAISSAKNLLSKSTLHKLYYSLIHSHFLYCLPVFSFTSCKNLSILVKKQKQCLRVINKAHFNAHTNNLFFDCKILPLEDLIIYQKAIFMHAIAHNYSSVSYPSFALNSVVGDHRFNLRNDSDFFVPRATFNIVSKMPLIDFPNTWNCLDQSIKDIPSLSHFKHCLKHELLDKYANFTCDKTLCISCMRL